MSSASRQSRQQRLLIQVFILTSIFWLSVDVLLFLTFLNTQFSFFESENIVPNVPALLERRSSLKFRPRVNNRKDFRTGRYEAFDIEPGLGELGEPASLPKKLKDAAENVFNNHSFNVLLSNRISLDRKLKDVRGPK